MKKFQVFLSAVFILFLIASSAGATIIFYDDFDSENSGVGALNYTGFNNWSVPYGTVDLIGNGFYDFLPGNGLYVDLDGSTSTAGLLVSTEFSLDPGDYIFKFDLAGNQRNTDPETTFVSFEVTIGSIYHDTISLNQVESFTTYTRNITITDSTLASIKFLGTGGDNMGMLLDNVSFETSPVPEPASILLLGTGLLGLAGYSRKKFRKK